MTSCVVRIARAFSDYSMITEPDPPQAHGLFETPVRRNVSQKGQDPFDQRLAIMPDPGLLRVAMASKKFRQPYKNRLRL